MEKYFIKILDENENIEDIVYVETSTPLSFLKLLENNTNRFGVEKL